MSRSVNLLVCLSPSSTPETITELSFYTMINPIAKVTNIRMVAREGQMKAFVEVENQFKAELVIGELHGRLLNLGKVKIFVSNKESIYYNRSLESLLLGHCGLSQEIYGKSRIECQDTTFPSKSNSNQFIDALKVLHKDKCTESQNIDAQTQKKVLSTMFFNNDNSKQAPLYNNIETDKITTKIIISDHDKKVQNDHITENSNSATGRIQVTHDNITTLDSKKVLKVFRRFGRVFELTFNSEKKFWNIQYKSLNEVIKAANAMSKNKLFGFRPYPETTGFNDNREDSCINQQNNIIGSKNEFQPAIETNFVTLFDSSASLKISTNNNNMDIRDVCKLVSTVRVPLAVAQVVDISTKETYFLAAYLYRYEAAEVLVSLSTVNYANCVRMILNAH